MENRQKLGGGAHPKRQKVEHGVTRRGEAWGEVLIRVVENP